MTNFTPAPGDRVRLTRDTIDPHPIAAGTEGTVTHVHTNADGWQASVDWDNGRRLMLLSDDQFEIIMPDGEALLTAIIDDADPIAELELLAFDDEEIGSRIESFVHDDKSAATPAEIQAVKDAAARVLSDDPVDAEARWPL